MSSLQHPLRRQRLAGSRPTVAAAFCSLLVLAAAPTLGLAAAPTGPSPQAVAEAARHVFVEVSTDEAGRSVYVQQQVPYTVRLYVDDTIRKGQLARPNPADAVVEQLGEDKRGTAVRGGRRFNVIERHYAISPEKSGTLRIPPVTFSGSQTVPEGAENPTPRQADDAPGDDLMARMLQNTPFANDPLLRRAFSQGTGSEEAVQPVSAQSAQVVVEVRPRPVAARGDWLPAQAITLHDSWRDAPPQLKAGEPATRILTIEARGLSASQIPPLSPHVPAHARLYPESADNQSHTDGNTIFGVSRQKLTYIPDAQGKLTVPAVDLPWWDVVADSPRTASLPPLSLNVAPGVVGGTAQSVPTSPASAATATRTVADRAAADGASGVEALGRTLIEDHRAWLAATALLAALLAAGGIGIRRARRHGVDLAGRDAPPVPQKAASLRALRRACTANDPVAAAIALLDLGRAQWPDDPPRALAALAARRPTCAEEIIALNRCLYGASTPSAWNGTALWQVMRREPKPRRTRTSFGDDALKALYPR